MNDEQPSQPLTGYELDNIEGRWSRYVALRDPDSMETSVHDVPDLLAEVDRLRAENHAVTAENSALLRKLEEQYRRRAQNAQELHVIRVSADMYDKGDDPLTLTLRHDGESLGTRIAELLSSAQHDHNAQAERLASAVLHAGRLRDSYEHGSLRRSLDFVEGAEDMAAYLGHARAMGVGDNQSWTALGLDQDGRGQTDE